MIRNTRALSNGLLLAGIVLLPALATTPASAMHMRKGKMMKSHMMMGRRMKGMTMSQSRMMRSMMAGMSSRDKRAMMGMSMSEKRAMMNSMKMHGNM
jgi:hypothetical protein